MRRLAAALMVTLACTAPIGARAQGPELPPGPNRDLVYAQCRVCHDLQYVVASAGIPADEWDAVLDNMKGFGLRITPPQREKILAYLGTYLGPNPPPAPAAATAAATADGATLFANTCVACHQHDGRGIDKQFPPLAGNKDLFLDRDFPALVLLFGMIGDITVEGTVYRSVMPPFGHLGDAEIAALVNYVRGAWGNDALDTAHLAPLDAAAVAAARAKNLTPEAVHAHRNDLR